MSGRVLIAGLFHETHTFLDEPTGLECFQIRVGSELLDAHGDGSPLAGVLDVADRHGWELIPVIDLRATPGGTVDDAVLNRFWSELDRVAAPRLAAGAVDGIFLVLHGAMVTASCRDVEGEVITRLRQLPGAGRVPICGVLDLHGNLSRRTIEPTQGLVAYRCNPHTDAHESAVRGALLLERILSEGRWPVSRFAQPAVMWPPTGTGTDDDPMRMLEAMARSYEQSHPDFAVVNVLAGFSFADTPDTGVSFSIVTFGDPAKADACLRELCDWTVAHRAAGCRLDPPLETVLPDIRADIAARRTPVIIVEPADNVGGGAPGDTTGLLRTLLDAGISNAAVVINDPVAVARLSTLPAGSVTSLTFGAAGSAAFCRPVEATVELLSLSDGRFQLEDRHSHLASMCGVQVDMGPCAVVRTGGVRVLLTSRKTPPFDLGQLRSQGIVPEDCDVIGVKAAVAHRRAYNPITGSTYTVATPGPCSSDLRSFPWRHVRRPVFPLDD